MVVGDAAAVDVVSVVFVVSSAVVQNSTLSKKTASSKYDVGSTRSQILSSR